MSKTNKRRTYIIKIENGKELDSCRTKARALIILSEQKKIQRRSDIVIEKNGRNSEKEVKNDNK